MTTQIETYAARAAARRAVVFALEPHESASDRRAEAVQARKLLEQAACMSVRAGEASTASDLLNIIGRLESAQR